jgi:hypothetical protein
MKYPVFSGNRSEIVELPTPDPDRPMERVLAALTAWGMRPARVERSAAGRATATWNVDDHDDRYVEARDSLESYRVMVLARDRDSAEIDVILEDVGVCRSILRSLRNVARTSSRPCEEGISLLTKLLGALEGKPDEVLTPQLVAELVRENGIVVAPGAAGGRKEG